MWHHVETGTEPLEAAELAATKGMKAEIYGFVRDKQIFEERLDVIIETSVKNYKGANENYKPRELHEYTKACHEWKATYTKMFWSSNWTDEAWRLLKKRLDAIEADMDRGEQV
jgi:hypothetical protein